LYKSRRNYSHSAKILFGLRLLINILVSLNFSYDKWYIFRLKSIRKNGMKRETYCILCIFFEES
jgi:hypothetical protein